MSEMEKNRARDPETSPEELEKMSREEKYRVGLAENPNLPYYIFKRLHRDKNSKVRKNLAKNPSIPRSVLNWMLKSERSDPVKSAILSNPRLPSKSMVRTLKRAVKEEDYFTINSLLKNPTITEEMLTLLYDADLDEYVVRKIAEHPETSLETLLKIYKEIEERQRYFREFYTYGSFLSGRPVSKLEILVAVHPNMTDQRVLKSMSEGEIVLKEKILLNPNVTAELLFKLLEENKENEVIQQRVKNHPNYTFEEYAEHFINS